MTDIISRHSRVDASAPERVDSGYADAMKAEIGEAAPGKEIFPNLRPIIRHIVSEPFALAFEPAKQRHQFRVQHLCLIAPALGVKGDCSFNKIDILQWDARFSESAQVQHRDVPSNLHRFIVRILAALGFKALFDDWNLIISDLRFDLAGGAFDSQLEAGIGVSFLSENRFSHNGRKKLELDPAGIVFGFAESEFSKLGAGRAPSDVVSAMLPVAFGPKISIQSEPCCAGAFQRQRVRVMNNEETLYPTPVLTAIRTRSGKLIGCVLRAKLASLPGLLTIITAQLSRFITRFSRQRVGITDIPERTSLLRVETRHKSAVGAVNFLKSVKRYCKPLKAIKRLCQATESRRFDSGPSHTYETPAQCSATAVLLASQVFA
jgi:hypothetical protein